MEARIRKERWRAARSEVDGRVWTRFPCRCVVSVVCLPQRTGPQPIDQTSHGKRETRGANWSKSGCHRLVELRSLLHTGGNPLVCAARAMYVIPDMDRYVLERL